MARWETALLLLAGASIAAAGDPRDARWTTASFVPPASPTLLTSSPPAIRKTLTPFGPLVITTPSTTTTAIWSKKKGSSNTATKKIQVKLLKHIAGTGQAGEVVLVTPAFYQNKLRPQKAATPITDEEVAEAQSEKRAQEEATNAAASALRDQFSEYTLHITRKAGPDGQLFGGVGPRAIIEELHSQVGDDYLKEKQVKITGLLKDGKKMRGDIKHTGDFVANLSLTKDISAKVSIQVDALS